MKKINWKSKKVLSLSVLAFGLIVSMSVAAVAQAQLLRPSRPGGLLAPLNLINLTLTTASPLKVGGTATSTITGDGSTSTIGGGLLVNGGGFQSLGTGSNSTIIGNGALASFDNNIAIGTSASSSGNSDAIAIGTSAAAKGNDGIAIGFQALTRNVNDAIAIGTNSIGSAIRSVAIGFGAQARNEVASGTDSVAIGTAAHTEARKAVAIGESSAADGDETIAIGSVADALPVGSIAIGSGNANTTWPASEYSIAFGYGANISNNQPHSIALGYSANPTRANQFMLGPEIGEMVFGSSTIKFGLGTTNPSSSLHVVGVSTLQGNVTINTGTLNATGTVATVSACGSSPSIVGTFWGRVTTGSNASSTCTVTFPTPFANPPVCVVNSQTTSSINYKLTTTSSTVVISTASSSAFISNTLHYQCLGL